MKQFCLVLWFILASVHLSYSQTKSSDLNVLKSRINRLESDIKSKQDSLIILNKKLKAAETKFLISKLQVDADTLIVAVAATNGWLRADSNVSSEELVEVQLGDTLYLLSFKDNYWLAKKDKHTGYISDVYIKSTSATRAYKASFETGKISPSKSYTPSSNSSKTIYTGPRGGKYYIDGNGKKVYVNQ